MTSVSDVYQRVESDSFKKPDGRKNPGRSTLRSRRAGDEVQDTREE